MTTPYSYDDAEGLCCDAYVFPVVLRLAREVQPPPATVLDAGCGNGALAGRLAHTGYEVTGVDLSADGIEIAKRHYPGCRFKVEPVDELMLERLGEDPFDLVVSTEVIEHLYDPHGFAEGVHRALRPGGSFILSTPYHGWLKNVAIALRGKFDEHVDPLTNGGHVKFFSRATITRLLELHGFCEIQFYGAGRRPWVWKSMVVTARRP